MPPVHDSSSKWILYAGAAPQQEPPPELEPWVQEIADAPRKSVGELKDCPRVEGAAPKDWDCTVIPEYILPHTFVAAASSPAGEYVMLFFTAVGEELHQQDRPPTPGLIGWFHVRLVKRVVNREALLTNLRHAFSLLYGRGILPAQGAAKSDA